MAKNQNKKFLEKFSIFAFALVQRRPQLFDGKLVPHFTMEHHTCPLCERGLRRDVERLPVCVARSTVMVLPVKKNVDGSWPRSAVYLPCCHTSMHATCMSVALCTPCDVLPNACPNCKSAVGEFDLRHGGYARDLSGLSDALAARHPSALADFMFLMLSGRIPNFWRIIESLGAAKDHTRRMQRPTDKEDADVVEALSAAFAWAAVLGVCDKAWWVSNVMDAWAEAVKWGSLRRIQCIFDAMSPVAQREAVCVRLGPAVRELLAASQRYWLCERFLWRHDSDAPTLQYLLKLLAHTNTDEITTLFTRHQWVWAHDEAWGIAMEAGADVNDKDSVPLQHAMCVLNSPESDSADFAVKLLQRGADPTRHSSPTGNALLTALRQHIRQLPISIPMDVIETRYLALRHRIQYYLCIPLFSVMLRDHAHPVFTASDLVLTPLCERIVRDERRRSTWQRRLAALYFHQSAAGMTDPRRQLRRW